MSEQQTHAVTGAYGYSGKYIANKLLEKGHKVITLTNSSNRDNQFGDKVSAYPFNFANPKALTKSLEGVSVLYNTYWVRFNHKTFTHSDAVKNTKILFNAARDADVKRIVHISITNPSEESHLEYFSGKAILENTLKKTGLSYAILRPTVLFGKEDILINNIAWTLRNLPLFGVFGDGMYRLQPIYVDDLANLAVTYGEKQEDITINAIGPETFTFRSLIETIGEIIGKKRSIISVSPQTAYLAAAAIGKLLNDVLITREEIEGLMADLLYVESEPTGKTSLTEWVKENTDTLGIKYANELKRRTDRMQSY